MPTRIRRGIVTIHGPRSKMVPSLLFSKLLFITAFSVVPSFASHQLSNVEKRHHELGAQRNDLFGEMQELLKQQQDEVAACREALAKSQQDAAHRGGGAAQAPQDEACTAAPPSASPPQAPQHQRDTIATIAGADRAAGRITGGAPHGGGGPAEETETADFANYFYSYAELDHQKQMLEDDRRMEAYRSSMLQNKAAFEGKTVLDVGSGSGVLAIFAAQAGAKKASPNNINMTRSCPMLPKTLVYAVEYTDMAKHARTVVEKNGFKDVIEVIQGSAESITLPEKVDVIVSEWMGYFLLRESMLDSVVVARDKWLKDTGLMFPSHASMVWAPVDDRDEKLRRDKDYDDALSSWSQFSELAMKKYGVDMSGLDEAYDEECAGFFSLSSLWRELSGRQVVSEPVTVKELDLHTCSLDDTKGLERTAFSFPLRRAGMESPPWSGRWSCRPPLPRATRTGDSRIQRSKERSPWYGKLAIPGSTMSRLNIDYLRSAKMVTMMITNKSATSTSCLRYCTCFLGRRLREGLAQFFLPMNAVQCRAVRDYRIPFVGLCWRS
ncbi:unnamed protein product [Pylaiella littoralis]